MAISSDEAIAKAREFASKVGWFTRRARVKGDASIIPGVWKVQLKGEYYDVTIEVNPDSGEVLKWHSSDPLLIAYERVKPIMDRLQAQEKPIDGRQWMEILQREKAKVLKKQKGPRSPDVDVPPFLKKRSKRPAKHVSNNW